MKLYMVRHGQTPYNNQKRIQGQIDIPLNDMGIEQAKTVAQMIQDQGLKIDHIVSSPLKRAHETANIIAKSIKHTSSIIINDRFIERNFGDLDGKTIQEAFPIIASNYQGPGYETDQSLISRVIEAIYDLHQAHPLGTILAVVHSQVIKAVFVHLDPKTFSFVNFTIENGEMVLFEVHQNHIEHIKK